MTYNFYDIILELGSKSKPILKFLIEKDIDNELSEDEKIYIKGTLLFWQGKLEEVIILLEKHTFTSTRFQILSYILLIYVFYYQNRQDLVEIYYKDLRSELQNVDKSLRAYIIQILCWYEIYYQNDYKRIDFLDLNDNYDPTNLSIFYNYKAKAYLAKKDINNWSFYITKAYDTIKNRNLPNQEISILNSIAYHSFLNNRGKKSEFYIKSLSKLIGKWEETQNFRLLLQYFDTLIICHPDPRIYNIFIRIVKSLPDVQNNYKQLADKILESGTDYNKVLTDYYSYMDKIDAVDISSEIYISHLRNYSNPDYLLKEMSLRQTKDKAYNFYIENERLTLVNKFFEHFSQEQKAKFDKYYFSLSEAEKEDVDRFVINYSRYKPYKSYITKYSRDSSIFYFYKKLKLNPNLAEICFYLWDEEDNKRSKAIHTVSEIIDQSI